ncbi:lysostaphin resistance A-like protein [Phenylobacterium sp.]|uniref:CPBP family intramembrane glutamic endopeptidase n=1 Tax=Phenylobacterium sp. TaxID=1871053 RepID=UPI0035B2AD34
MSVFLEYARRGRNAWWRYLLTLVLAFTLAIAAGLAVIALLDVLNLLPADFADQVQNPGRPVAFFTANGVIFAVIIAGLAIAARLVQAKRFADLLGAWSWRGFARGAAIWTAVLCLAALIDFAIAPQGFRLSADARTPSLIAIALPMLAVQTFAEEFLFRGYVTQGLLLATKRVWAAALISGLLFGALHIPNGGPQAASAAAFGVVMAFVAIRTGGIAFTWGLHLANNLFGAVVVVSGGDVFHNTPGLITQTTPHLMWWDAGVGVAALAAVAVLVARGIAAPRA